ncbi:MAG: hypothetical protein ACTSQ0_03005 [Candidatus Heimdallarchaeota archaeon]
MIKDIQPDYDPFIMSDISQASFFESAGARFTESYIRAPLASLYRFGELSIAKENIYSGILDEEGYKNSPYFRKDIKWHEGMTEDESQILSERKDAERQRQDVMRRTPTGLIRGGALMAVDFAAQLLDPLNIAASFVPIVGQTKFIRMAGTSFGARLVGARTATGVIEGLAGATLVEPIVLAAARQEQADYDMYDSLMAISFGSVFGAGTHVGFGKIGDILGISRYANDASVKTAISDVLSNKNSQIDKIITAERSSVIDSNLKSEPIRNAPTPDDKSYDFNILKEETIDQNKVTQIKVGLDDIDERVKIGSMEIEQRNNVHKSSKIIDDKVTEKEKLRKDLENC